MMTIYLGYAAMFFVGALIGVFATSLCKVSGGADRDAEEEERRLTQRDKESRGWSDIDTLGDAGIRTHIPRDF